MEPYREVICNPIATEPPYGFAAVVERLHMPESPARASPWLNVRITGGIYLAYFLTTVFAQILDGRGLVEYWIMGNVITNMFYVAVTVLLYDLFKPVDKNLSLLAAFFSLAGCAVATLGLFHVTPYDASPLIFFGPFCLLIGYLIIRSTFLPRTLGVLMVLAAIGWLVYLSPLATPLDSAIEVVGIVAEGSLMLWLLIMGMNVQRWSEQSEKANAAR